MRRWLGIVVVVLRNLTWGLALGNGIMCVWGHQVQEALFWFLLVSACDIEDKLDRIYRRLGENA